jgi:hypothetical protein
MYIDFNASPELLNFLKDIKGIEEKDLENDMMYDDDLLYDEEK